MIRKSLLEKKMEDGVFEFEFEGKEGKEGKERKEGREKKEGKETLKLSEIKVKDERDRYRGTTIYHPEQFLFFTKGIPVTDDF